jgi:undecaprenyl-diphosphatase
MTAVQSIILGIVEGITEFIPVSSTGHLILASVVLGLQQNEFLKTFEIVIQSGAIAAVLVLYWQKFLDPQLLKRIGIAFVPTGILGVLLYPFIKAYLLQNEIVVVVSLALGGVALIVFERLYREKSATTENIAHISTKQALAVGFVQSVAFIPGVSRSAATIAGGMLGGMSRRTIVEFSFLLAVPTMLAATTLDLLKTDIAFSSQDLLMLAIGFLVSFFVAIASIKGFLELVKRYSFTPFGVYRIVIAVVFLMFLL